METRIEPGVPEGKLQQAQIEAHRWKGSTGKERIHTCIHEGAHLLYAKKIGMECSLHGPSIYWDSEASKFKCWEACVKYENNPLVQPDEATAIAIAKEYLAPAIVLHALTDRSVDLIVRECHMDMKRCRRWWKYFHRHLKDQVLTEEEGFHKLLADTRESILIDLCSSRFRRQLFDAAIEVHCFFAPDLAEAALWNTIKVDL
jgi:hypothetical protein